MGIIEEQYRAAQGKLFEPDPAQIVAVEKLQTLYDQLIHGQSMGVPQKNSRSGWLTSCFGNHRQPANCYIPGLYLWGGVGRGKTWLMDLFYGSLEFDNKLRLHFRHFMQDIHDDLTSLSGHQNPLQEVAQHFARRARVICLDEFFVEDISDAMILYNLLQSLLMQGITMVFTSNLAPEELYRNGLQRERFLPAIDLIHRCTTVHQLNGDIDHRLRKLTRADTYFTPVNEASEFAMEQRFFGLAPNLGTVDLALNINHRQISSLRCADDVAWFNFYQLCRGPRSSSDYIELARRFHTVLISGVPKMGEGEEDLAHRFVDLVDEFYDRKVKLILSAEDKPAELYQGHRLRFQFQRTLSRLMEMHSKEYLATPHRP